VVEADETEEFPEFAICMTASSWLGSDELGGLGL
jgi:hypothetical protein